MNFRIKGFMGIVNGRFLLRNFLHTLPETNSSRLKISDPKRKLVFQPCIFRCELLVSGRVFFQLQNEPNGYVGG